ncbi:unnamed protein product [Ostreobium quekettii]|uniref:Uncharacterized protein n=1 Tax=Ostreobium quekettii TaxID=121088 RepID=A0A8S1ITK4_9CHLO|nr:unnamed protein product [Ostreobium quekettii]
MRFVYPPAQNLEIFSCSNLMSERGGFVTIMKGVNIPCNTLVCWYDPLLLMCCLSMDMWFMSIRLHEYGIPIQRNRQYVWTSASRQISEVSWTAAGWSVGAVPAQASYTWNL